MDVRPVDSGRWDDLVALFGPNGAYSGCWCMWWRVPSSTFGSNGNPGNQAALAALVGRDMPVGLLAYEDGKPVGWAALAPRSAFPRILRSPALKPTNPAAPVWSVPCFFVRQDQRGSGVAEALLRAAVKQAANAGAPTLEGYPVEVTPQWRPSPAELYTGTVAMFERVGFEVTRRPPSGRRVIMHRDL